MRTNNPVLSRPEAFQRQGQPAGYGQPYPQPGYGQPPYGQAPYGAPQQFGQAPYQPAQEPAGVMTIDDVITKTAITMGTLFVVAAATFLFLPYALLYPAMIVSSIVGFVTVMVVAMRRRVNPGAVLGYAVVEGVFVGAISKMFEGMWNGIVPTAIFATLVASAMTLAAYKFLRLRVTGTFRKVVTIGTMALAALYLINLVLSLFRINTGLVGAGPDAGLLAFAISAIAIVLAVANLIMDFEYVEQGIAQRAPASESWRAAFGLTVTIVWMYVEILRILSYFRNN